MVSKQLAKQQLKIEEIINLQQYPILDLSQPKSLNLISHCRQQLQHKGCCVLKKFLTGKAI
ncbi:MAG: hypothetical protein MJK14_05930, partial [Rivularia sp. ALOHA_DT_140]|nr:hypothetical protein [Rivularia sp. ALOHA_DT_140]